MRSRNIGGWNAQSRNLRWHKKLQIPRSKLQRSSKNQTPIRQDFIRMKWISPLTIIAVGPILLGVALPFGTYLALPSARHLADMGWASFIGVIAGLVSFGPMAAVIWIKNRFPEWFVRNYYRLHWYTSMAMGIALGFWIACSIYQTSGKLLLVSFGIILLGASTKIGLSDKGRADQSLGPAQGPAQD
jgi:hypothetical protein